MANEKPGIEPAAPTFTQAQMDEAVRTATASTMARTDASEIARICGEGGEPQMAARLLSEGATVAEAKARVGTAGAAKDIVARARRKDATIPEDLATTMLAEGKSVQDVRDAVLDKMVANEDRTAISSHIPADDPANTASAKPVDLTADMKRRHGVKD